MIRRGAVKEGQTLAGISLLEIRLMEYLKLFPGKTFSQKALAHALASHYDDITVGSTTLNKWLLRIREDSERKGRKFYDAATNKWFAK